MIIETVPREGDAAPSPWLPGWMWDGCKDTDPQPFPKHILDTWVNEHPTWPAPDPEAAPTHPCRSVPVRVFPLADEIDKTTEA